MTNLAEQLETILSGEVDEKFVVKDLRSVEWVVRKIKAKQRETEEAKVLAAEQVKEINEWLQAVVNEAQQDIDRLTALLTPYLEAEAAERGKKSIKVPSGVTKIKKQPLQYLVDGTSAGAGTKKLLDWARENEPDFIKTEIKESVAWAEMKKTLKADADSGRVYSENGEEIGFIQAYQPPDKVVVE